MALAVMALLALGDATALAANDYAVSRVQVSPAGGGSATRPVPVRVGFGLDATAADPAMRATPVTSYRIAAEGIVAFPGAFPKCSLADAKRRKGVPRRCAAAKIGNGSIKAAGGLSDDESIESSVPCNLRLAVYNLGTGLALRLDVDPPIPPSFGSNRLGCPVPIHTAVALRLARTSIDGVPSTVLGFGVPDTLLHPLDGWDGAMQLVRVSMGLKEASARVGGRTRTVGFFSSAGCGGGRRTVTVEFSELGGERHKATRTARC